jgi:hypothetical protein
MSQTLTHQPLSAIHVDEREWETLRWPGQWSKMLFHPRAEAPTEPNAGLVRYGPGTMLHYPDPHFEPPLVTETGGLMLFVQYQGPTTGGRPVYDGRFNMTTRRQISEENVER